MPRFVLPKPPFLTLCPLYHIPAVWVLRRRAVSWQAFLHWQLEPKTHGQGTQADYTVPRLRLAEA